MTRNVTLLLPNDAAKTHNSRHHHQQEQDGEEEEEEEERFYESLDRIASSSCSCSTSNSDSETDPNPTGPDRAVPADFVRYDVWISEPASISERRQRLLRQMGLSDDPSLSRSNPRSDRKTLGRPEIGIVRSKSDGGGEDDDCCFNSCSSSVLSVYCDDDNYNNNNNNSSSCGSILLRDSIDVNKCNLSYDNSSGDKGGNNDVNNGNAAVIVVDNVGRNSGGGGSGNSPSKPPLGRRMDGNHRSDSANSNGNLNVNWSSAGFMGEFVEELDCNGADGGTTAGEEMQVCVVKNLDNGKEFVVNEVTEDGTWKELKEVGTGRQLTMEEFEMSVGHSPIVQELMRRQNAEDGSRENLDLSTNGGIGGANSKMKKKSGWFRSIKSVTSSVTGNKERRSSDERDTGSERGGRRSSSATDDSQDRSFHGPERVRVRQYGKSFKELSALFKGQEIQAHNGSIWSIKFSLDGKYLASAGEDCVIHVWQVVESERKGELLMEKSEDGNFNFFSIVNGSPEPTVLSPTAESYHEKKRRGRPSVSRKSSVSLDHIMVPETVFGLTDKPICSFRGHLDDVLDLSWSKSQHLLSSSMDKTVRLWHLSSKTCLKIFSHSDYDVTHIEEMRNWFNVNYVCSPNEQIFVAGHLTCIQFNPIDDNYFISGSLDAKVRIWNINERQVVDWNDLHEMVTAACYTPDGQGALVGSYKGSCHLYNTSENKLQQNSHINLQNKKKKTHLKKITGFQFAPGSSSEVLITSADSRVRVVDDGDLVHKFKGFRNTNSQISASHTANGKYVVSASEDSYVYVWKHEAESRPSRSKGVTITRSYEHFHCQDVSVAIPWPGLADSWGLHDAFSGEQSAPDNHLDEVSIVNHPPTPVEEIGNDGSLSLSGGTNSPLNGIISSATNGYFFDRISATWPEEKLSLATRARSPHNSLDMSNGISQNMAAYGMVIVTAGLRGEIKTFQNFGLPVRI